MQVVYCNSRPAVRMSLHENYFVLHENSFVFHENYFVLKVASSTLLRRIDPLKLTSLLRVEKGTYRLTNHEVLTARACLVMLICLYR